MWKKVIALTSAVLLAGNALAQFASTDGTDPTFGGAVNADGTVQGNPKAFTVVRLKTGDYKIKFKRNYSRDPVCLFNAISAEPISTYAILESKSYCEVRFFNSDQKIARDVIFNFIVSPIM